MKLWQGLAIVTLLWAALYLPFLGSNELRGEEARRVLPARTMLVTGDWVVPRIGGEEYASKPPLINWTIAALFALTGVENEWTARLPSVLWLLAFALVATGMLAGRLGVWGAASAALFFLGAVGVLDKGRMAEIEAMYTAQTGIAFVLWAVWWTEGRRWRAYLVPAIFLGLGMLAKGPMHLFVFYGAVISALWLAKRRIELAQAPHLLGLAVIAAIFLPWVVLNLRQVQAPEATSAAWLDQLAVRFSFRRIDWVEWLLLPVQIMKDFLPGSVLLVLLWRVPDSTDRMERGLRSARWSDPAAESRKREAESRDSGPVVGRDLRARRENDDDRWHCVIEGAKMALLGGWILLSLSPEFRPRYAMPLFGIAAVVVGGLLARLPAGSELAQRIDRWWRRLNRVAVVAVVAGAVIAMAAAWGWLEGIAWWHAWPGLLAGLALYLGWRRVERWRPLVVACTILAVAQILVLQFSRPWKDRHGLCRPVARDVQAMIPDDGRKLLFFRPGFLRFLFYLERPYEEVVRLSGADTRGAGYLAVREPDLDHGPVTSLLGQRKGVELGRREIEGRRFVFFQLEGDR